MMLSETQQDGMEREESMMNYNLDQIRRIQTQLPEIPCGSCRRQGLTLLLRYAGKDGQCLFDAFCKACQRKNLVDPNIVQGLNDQKLHKFTTIPTVLVQV